MARTNSIITVNYRNKSYSGTQTSILTGNYAAWMEDHISAESISSLYGGSTEFLERARGLGMIFEDVNLVNSYIVYNNNQYEILKYAKFLDYRGTVRHVEFIYG